MSTTKIQIENRALVKCGAKQAASFGSGSAEDLVVAGVYNDMRDEVLMEHPWTFAQKRYALLDITYPASTATVSAWVTATVYAVRDYVTNGGITYRCQVAHTSAAAFATDLTAIKWARVADAAIALTEDNMSVVYTMPSDLIKLNYTSDAGCTYNFETILVNSAVTKVILANVSSLKIQYTYQNDDPTLYNILFTNALVARLASEIAPNFSATRTIAKELLKEYEEIHLPRAISADSQQSTPLQPIQDEWEVARFSTGILGAVTPGRQTWPYGGGAF